MKRFEKDSLAVLLASIGILGLAGFWLLLQLIDPSDGSRIQHIGPMSDWSEEGIYIDPLNAQVTPLQSGDIVIALDDQTVEYWAQNIMRLDIPRPTWTKGQTVLYTVRRGGQILSLPVKLGDFPLSSLLRLHWVNLVSFCLMVVIGWFVFYTRPKNPAAQLMYLSMVAVVSSLMFWTVSYQLYDVLSPWRFWFYRCVHLFGFLGNSLLLHFALVFPKPQQAVLSHRWLKVLIYLSPVVGFIGSIIVARLITPNPLIWMAETAVINDRIGLVLLLLAVTAALAGYWNSRSDSAAREQLRWVIGGFLMTLGFLFLLNLLPKLVGGPPILQREASGLIALPFVLGIAVAILRYHLFDIDILINRTLVYGALTAIVVSGYVLIVGLLGKLFEVQGNIWISLIVTGLVAVLFQPLRERVQHGVNHLMYGERDSPYTVLTRLSRRLGAAMPPDMILPRVIETIAQALKLPYAAIAYEQDGEQHIAAEFGLVTAPGRIHEGVDEEARTYPKEYLNIPLVYQSEELGRLILAPRAWGEGFTPADIRFLEEVASQAGAVVYTVKLTEDLQRSREKLVTTREEERRRLRRDLHDGIGSILASLAFNLDAANNLIDRDPVATKALIKELKVQTQTAMADIRRLAYDLRPPVLDELGFVNSLHEYIKGIDHSPGLCIEFNPPKDLRGLPAAIEVAAYRISVEAVKNVIRHAQAHHCTVNVTLNALGSLEVDIVDDGQGLPIGWHAGVGISAMRERALELGGTFELRPNSGHGTRVLVRLPLSRE